MSNTGTLTDSPPEGGQSVCSARPEPALQTPTCDSVRYEPEELGRLFLRWSTQVAILVREPYPSLFRM